MSKGISRSLGLASRNSWRSTRPDDSQPLDTLDPPVRIQHCPQRRSAHLVGETSRGRLDAGPELLVRLHVRRGRESRDGQSAHLGRVHDGAQLPDPVQDRRAIGFGAVVVGVDDGRIAVVGRGERDVSFAFGLDDGDESRDRANVCDEGVGGAVLVDEMGTISGLVDLRPGNMLLATLIKGVY